MPRSQARAGGTQTLKSQELSSASWDKVPHERPKDHKSAASVNHAKSTLQTAVGNALPPLRRARALETAPKPQAAHHTRPGLAGSGEGGFRAYVALQ